MRMQFPGRLKIFFFVRILYDHDRGKRGENCTEKNGVARNLETVWLTRVSVIFRNVHSGAIVMFGLQV